MYKPLPDGVTIKESQVQGLGLFATKDFDAEVVLGIVHILDKNFPHGAIRTALGAFIIIPMIRIVKMLKASGIKNQCAI